MVTFLALHAEYTEHSEKEGNTDCGVDDTADVNYPDTNINSWTLFGLRSQLCHRNSTVLP